VYALGTQSAFSSVAPEYGWQAAIYRKSLISLLS
jgi:hypothetical protein